MKTFQEVQEAAKEFIKTKRNVIDVVSKDALDVELLTTFAQAMFKEGYLLGMRDTINDLKPITT